MINDAVLIDLWFDTIYERDNSFCFSLLNQDDNSNPVYIYLNIFVSLIKILMKATDIWIKAQAFDFMYRFTFQSL